MNRFKALYAVILALLLIFNAFVPSMPLRVSAEDQMENIYGDATGNGVGIGVPFEFGTVFSVLTPGYIMGVRVFGVEGESGDHIVRIWSNPDDEVVAGPYTFNFTGSNKW